MDERFTVEHDGHSYDVELVRDGVTRGMATTNEPFWAVSLRGEHVFTMEPQPGDAEQIHERVSAELQRNPAQTQVVKDRAENLERLARSAAGMVSEFLKAAKHSSTRAIGYTSPAPNALHLTDHIQVQLVDDSSYRVLHLEAIAYRGKPVIAAGLFKIRDVEDLACQMEEWRQRLASNAQ